MRKKQLSALCVCNFVIFTGISGLFGLMPLYLTQIGADAGSTGFVLAVAYLSLAISTVVGGHVSNRLQRRTSLLMLGGVLAAPITWSMRSTTTVAPLLILLASLWFVTGISMTMTNILVGLFAEPGNRGRSFGMVNLSSGLGLFFGNLVSGRIVDQWGFPALFGLLGTYYLLIPCVGLVVQDKRVRDQGSGNASHVRDVLINRTFMFLFIASIVGQASNVVIALSRPLIMHRLHFDATTITTAAAIGSLVSLPLPLVVGRLSDRFGRKPLILLCFLTTPLGLIVLGAAVHVWHFWVASILQTVLGVSVVVGSALVTDIFPEEALGTALSLLTATPWIGIVIGLSAGGVAIKTFQMTPTLMLSVLVSLVAIVLLMPITAPQPAQQSETT